MASLNTLRTKFGVILSIIIGLALLAFILSLKTDMGFSNNDPKVGVMNGSKIPYSEYSVEYNKLQEQNAQSNVDPEKLGDQISAAAWQSFFQKLVLEPSFEKMGVVVSEAERLQMLSGAHISPVFSQYFANPATGTYDAAAVQNFLTQAETSPEAQQAWIELQKQAKQQRQVEKYLSLIKNGVNVNSLDVNNGVEGANNNFAGKFVNLKYSAIADSLVKVETADLKAYYKAHKAQYKQLPSRTISYVVFDVEPTAEDMAAIEQKAAEVGDGFAAATDIEAFLHGNYNATIGQNFLSKAQLTPDEADLLMAGNQYGPVLKNNEWTMSRVVEQKNAPDSIGVKHIVLSYQQTALADSLYKALNVKGADFEAAAREYSLYEQTAVLGGEVGVMPYSAFTTDFTAALDGAKVGDVVRIDTGDMIQLMKIYRADALSKHVRVATVTYPVEASPETIKDVYNKAGLFLGAAKGTVENFNAAAADNALTPRVATVAQGDRTVRGLDDSREIVRWVYGAKNGELSQIFKAGKDYVVATVTDIDDKEYKSLQKVADQVRTAVLRDKKYDYIVNGIEGATLDQIAKANNADVTAFQDVTYASYYVPSIGFEPAVIGAIVGSEGTGTLSAPIKGNMGVFFFVVDNVADNEKQSFEAEQVRMQAQAERAIEQGSFGAIQEAAKIQDLRGKYF